jgi:hypothetical protein
MDEHAVAQTLRELERKLLELEGTLKGLGSGNRPAPSAPTEPWAPAPRTPPQSFSRIVDETIEPPRAPLPPSSPPARPESETSAAAVPSAPTAPLPPAVQSAPPGPAELLRFRERLERSARDLTHDYDELL